MQQTKNCQGHLPQQQRDTCLYSCQMAQPRACTNDSAVDSQLHLPDMVPSVRATQEADVEREWLELCQGAGLAPDTPGLATLDAETDHPCAVPEESGCNL